MEKTVTFQPAYDRVDEGGGRSSARCWFCLKGPKGAVTFSISTGWYLKETREIFTVNNWDTHGDGQAISTHANWPYEDYLKDNPHEDCEWLDGDVCYGDTGFIAAEHAFEALVSEGEDALWKILQNWYDDLPEKPE